MRLFRPLLVGATLSGRLFACLGAAFGIAVATIVSTAALGAAVPIIVAPIGASAVLVFAVPASPLAQPWSVIGGNIASALLGVAVAKLVPDVALASGLAVAGAILLMSLLRCLHPPGGAAALTAVIGGEAVTAAGWSFALVPIGINSMLLVASALLFHRMSRHPYPHRPIVVEPLAMAPAPVEPHPEDLDRAIEDFGETFDVAREDLDALLARVAVHAEVRRRHEREADARSVAI